MERILHPATSERLEGVGEYYFSRKLREIDALKRAGRPIISLGIGSPDRPPHPAVIEALHRAALRPDAHAYQSYKGTAALREAFARWYDRRFGVALDPESEILPLIGSKEGLMHICMTFLRRGDRVLVPDPGYPTYRSAVTLSGGEAVPYPLAAEKAWLPDFDALERRGLHRVTMMILNYPQMPTGALPTRSMFARAVEFALRNDILLVHDNPYGFIRNEEPLSLLATPGARGCAIELNSLSKSHNMAGWRMAMVASNPTFIKWLVKVKSNVDSGQFKPMMKAAVKALSLDKDWYDELNAEYASRRETAMKIMEALHCNADPSQQGLFLWGRIPDGAPSGEWLADRVLYDARVFITPGFIFGNNGDRYIRISLCATRDNMERALERIVRYMQS